MNITVDFQSSHVILLSVGALCEYTETTSSEALRQSCDSFDAYRNSLAFSCRNGTRGTLVWTPDENTPNLVYYQVQHYSSASLLAIHL